MVNTLGADKMGVLCQMGSAGIREALLASIDSAAAKLVDVSAGAIGGHAVEAVTVALALVAEVAAPKGDLLYSFH